MAWPKQVKDYHAALDAWEAKYAELLDETTERSAFFEHRADELRGAYESMSLELLILRRAMTHLGRTHAEARAALPGGQNSYSQQQDFILDGVNYGKAGNLLWLYGDRAKDAVGWT